MSLGEFGKLLEEELQKMGMTLIAEASIQVLEHEGDEQDNDILAATEVTKIQAAVDSELIYDIWPP